MTPQLLQKALEGKSLTGPGKTRLLRAVNRVLEQKKQDAVDIRALFERRDFRTLSRTLRRPLRTAGVRFIARGVGSSRAQCLKTE